MAIRKTVGTVGTLAHGAVSTAVSVAKHPIGTAAMAAGLVKGATEAGIDLVRGTLTGSPAAGPVSAEPEAPEGPDLKVAVTAEPVTPEPETSAEPQAPETQAPERDLPGPDVVAPEVPDIDDLPEPIVIEAEPVTEPVAEVGESFHTEPKAASRDSDHGGMPGDREEAEGYVEEIPSGDDEPVWTSETPAGQVDDQTESVFDEAAAKAVLSEAEILQKAAEQHKE